MNISEQNFTEAQKARERQNIGAGSDIPTITTSEIDVLLIDSD